MLKKCSKCGVEKPLTEFYRESQNKDGYRGDCKVCKNLCYKEWSAQNKEYRNSYKKEYHKINKERERIYRKNYEYRCYHNNIQFKLAKLLRNSLRYRIKNNQRYGSAVNDLGCTVEELKEHLELQFKDGMTWDNWSLEGWHIDHIIPLSFFDLTDEEQFKKACHYTNLQPLWAEDNYKKKLEKHSAS